ncbi:MAG: hypothetical protein KFW07_03840, partial [Mycoplasmataceae bacterium]|nr:hypothetical protein [Mycoplasmataceae bacterium]
AFSENKINNIVMGIGLKRIDVFAFENNLLDYNTFPNFSNVPIANNLFLGNNVFFQNYINGDDAQLQLLVENKKIPGVLGRPGGVKSILGKQHPPNS